MSAERLQGAVLWYNPVKGYGFIKVPGRKDDLFFHSSGLDDEFETPEEDDRVEFVIIEGRQGPQADNVRLA